MRPKNKYRKGSTIFSWSSLMYDNIDKGKWVYLRDRVINPGFILNMTLITVRGFLEGGFFREAIDAQKEYDDNRG